MKTKQLLLCALFAAVTAASVFLPKIPIPGTTIMFTFQTLAVFLTGLMLKPKFAFISQIVYMALGLVGLPVFMNPAVAGFAYILQPTFGFIIGFAVCAFLISLLVRRQIYALYDAKTTKSRIITIIKLAGFALISIIAMYEIGRASCRERV
jgi:biotin transport system substrate-specific component